ncbi:hypothetical protein OROMI_002117 [Orobanche minor]
MAPLWAVLLRSTIGALYGAPLYTCQGSNGDGGPYNHR